MLHVIQKQMVDFRLQGIAADASVLDQLSKLCHSVVLPAVEGVLDGYADSSEYLIIDKLELDLGSIKLNELQNLLDGTIAKALEQRLQDTSESMRLSEYDSFRQGKGETNSGSEYLQQEEAEMLLLATYLATGKLPWWSGNYNLKGISKILEDHLWYQPERFRQILYQLPATNTAKRLSIQFNVDLNWQLISLLAQQRQSWGEVLCQVVAVLFDQTSLHAREHLNANLVEKLLCDLLHSNGMASSQTVYQQIITATKTGNISDLQRSVKALKQAHELLLNVPEKPPKQFIKQILQKNHVLSVSEKDNAPAKSDTDVIEPSSQNRQNELWPNTETHKTTEYENKGITEYLYNEKSEPKVKLLKDGGMRLARDNDLSTVLRQNNTKKTGHDTAQQDIEKKSDKSLVQTYKYEVYQNHTERDTVQQDNTTKPVRTMIQSFESSVQHSTVRETPKTRLLKEDWLGDERLYIHSAGLILLWQYLPRYFESLGLMRDGNFIAGDRQERAVLLLQYLTGFATEFFEEEMAMSKILCGLDVETPVAICLEPELHERHEAEELLLSVIGHWSALGGTSIAGLQTAFLQREGRLVRNDLGWQLLVERKSYDMLLNKLPWGFGLIRLKWMQQSVSVEW